MKKNTRKITHHSRFPYPVKLKRVYDAPAEEDGLRVLVERLWPRGLTKEKAQVHLWLKDIAPTASLRKWFGHDKDKWPEFQRRYRAELQQNSQAVAQLRKLCREQPVTLVFAARDSDHNSAVVLKHFLEQNPDSSQPDQPARLQT